MILYWVLTSLALVGVSFQDNQGTPTVTLDRFCHKKDFSGWIFVKHLDALSPTWQASILLFLSSAQIFVGPMSTGKLESDMKLHNRLFGFLTFGTFGQNLLSPLSKIVVSYFHRTRKVTTIERYFTVSESRKLLLTIFFRDHTDGKTQWISSKIVIYHSRHLMIPWSSLSEVGWRNPVAPHPAIITPSDTSWWWLGLGLQLLFLKMFLVVVQFEDGIYLFFAAWRLKRLRGEGRKTGWTLNELSMSRNIFPSGFKDFVFWYTSM